MEASGTLVDPAVAAAEAQLAEARAAVLPPVEPDVPTQEVVPSDGAGTQTAAGAPSEPSNAELQAQLAALTAKLASIPEPEQPAPPKVPVTARLAELKAGGVSLAESFEHLVREGYQTFIPVAEHSTTLQALVTIVDEIAGKL
jgi:hypothetical protein